jgi:hypothetical protein
MSSVPIDEPQDRQQDFNSSDLVVTPFPLLADFTASTIQGEVESTATPITNFLPSAPPKATQRTPNSKDTFPVGNRANQKRPKRQSTADRIQQLLAPYSSPGPEEYPSAEDFEMESKYTRSSKGAHKRQSSSASISTAFSDRLSWFKNKAFAKPGADEEQPRIRKLQPLEDPMLSLDIHSNLFPLGEPDSMNPSAFHDLLANAESVIMSLQAAYRTKCQEVLQLQAQNSEQAEELDESETRNRHLKSQLDDISSRMANNEQDLQRKVTQEQEKREDMEFRWRHAVEDRSPRSWTSENSDSGFESDGESELKSPKSDHFFLSEAESSPAIRTLGSPILLAQSKTMDYDSVNSSARNSLLFPLGGLKTENEELKIRVAELEAVVDSCLLLL